MAWNNNTQHTTIRRTKIETQHKSHIFHSICLHFKLEFFMLTISKHQTPMELATVGCVVVCSLLLLLLFNIIGKTIPNAYFSKSCYHQFSSLDIRGPCLGLWMVLSIEIFFHVSHCVFLLFVMISLLLW